MAALPGNLPIPLPGETVPQMIERIMAEQKQAERDRTERLKKAAADRASNPIWLRDVERIQKRELKMLAMRRELDVKELVPCSFKPASAKKIPASSTSGAVRTSNSVSESLTLPQTSRKPPADTIIPSSSTDGSATGYSVVGRRGIASVMKATAPRHPSAEPALAQADYPVGGTGPREYDPSAGFDSYALDASEFGDGPSGSRLAASSAATPGIVYAKKRERPHAGGRQGAEDGPLAVSELSTSPMRAGSGETTVDELLSPVGRILGPSAAPGEVRLIASLLGAVMPITASGGEGRDGGAPPPPPPGLPPPEAVRIENVPIPESSPPPPDGAPPPDAMRITDEFLLPKQPAEDGAGVPEEAALTPIPPSELQTALSLVSELQVRLVTVEAERDELSQSLERVTASLADDEVELDSVKARLVAEERELLAVTSTLAEDEAVHEADVKQARSLEGRIGDMREELAALKQQLAASQARALAAEVDVAAAAARHERELRDVARQPSLEQVTALSDLSAKYCAAEAEKGVYMAGEQVAKRELAALKEELQVESDRAGIEAKELRALLAAALTRAEASEAALASTQEEHSKQAAEVRAEIGVLSTGHELQLASIRSQHASDIRAMRAGPVAAAAHAAVAAGLESVSSPRRPQGPAVRLSEIERWASSEAKSAASPGGAASSRSPVPAPPTLDTAVSSLEFADILDALAAEVSALRAKLSAAEDAAAGLQARAEGSERENAELRKRCDSAEELAVRSRAELHDLKTGRRGETQVKVDALAKEYEGKAAELATERAAWLAQLQSENAELQATFKEARATKDSLLGELSNLAAERGALAEERETREERESMLYKALAAVGVNPPLLPPLPVPSRHIAAGIAAAGTGSGKVRVPVPVTRLAALSLAAEGGAGGAGGKSGAMAVLAHSSRPPPPPPGAGAGTTRAI